MFADSPISGLGFLGYALFLQLVILYEKNAPWAAIMQDQVDGVGDGGTELSSSTFHMPVA